MKKIYAILAAALAVGTTATAVVTSPQVTNKFESAQQNVKEVGVVKSENAVWATSASTRADETIGTASVVSPIYNFSSGMSSSGYRYNNPFVLLPAFGPVTFTGVAEGATAYEWTWNNGHQETSASYKDFTVNGAVNTINYEPGEMIYQLTMTATNGDAVATATPLASAYMGGASLDYYGFTMSDQTVAGLTMYPCAPGGTRVGYMGYNKAPADAANYDANGTFTGWADVLPLIYGGEAADYSNIKIKEFSTIYPAQSSAYFFDSMTCWMYCGFSEATTLEGHIYPVVNNTVQQDKPIARIVANVEKAAVDGAMVNFNVIPLDEDGDDIEGSLVVDNQDICITIEKVYENSSIIALTPIFGNGTTFPVDTNSPWYTNSYVSVEYTKGGQTYVAFRACPYNYYEDDARTTMFRPANYYWSINACFPWVLNADGGRDFNVTAPVAGGDVEVSATALYYNLKGLVSVGKMDAESDSDWLTFSIGDGNQQTGESIITVSATALPSGVSGREGKITFTGMAQDFTINVTQGEVASVGEIVVDANAETVYYDLQGRKVMGTPDKGIYIVKEGNKTRKVVL